MIIEYECIFPLEFKRPTEDGDAHARFLRTRPPNHRQIRSRFDRNRRPLESGRRRMGERLRVREFLTNFGLCAVLPFSFV